MFPVPPRDAAKVGGNLTFGFRVAPQRKITYNLFGAYVLRWMVLPVPGRMSWYLFDI
jgi:hypothetical protein